MPATANRRTESIELVATTLLPRASRLARLLLRSGDRVLSRTEAGLLTTLLDGPRSVTELAESEALAQPTATQVVERLQQRGLVAKQRSATDGRVVLVSVSAAGRRQLTSTQTAYRALLREAMDGLDDAQLAELAGATETLGRLIDGLQRP